MAVEDFIEPEVGIAVALTAAVASPGVRKVLRKGAVYGLAGILMAGDAVSALAQGVKRGVQQADVPGTAEEEALVTAPEILSAGTAEKPSAETAPEAATAPKRVRKTAEAPVVEAPVVEAPANE